MTAESTSRSIDVVILAGGKGTRLRPVVANSPKSMALVNDRPFLDYQLAQLSRSPLVGKVVLALGHLADQVVAHYRTHAPVVPLTFVIEEMPLGTAGAVRNALPHTTSDVVIVMNGDSLFDLDVAAIVETHRRCAASATIALLRVPDAGRYGRVSVEGDRVTAFTEKTAGEEPGTINAGVYLFERRVLENVAPGIFVSMEHAVLPKLAEDGRLAGTIFRSDFIDIGLPETYRAADAFVRRLFPPRSTR